MATSYPVFDYSSRDYTSIFNDLVARIPVYLPEWTSRSNADFGIVMLQMFAYTGDLLHYYMDRLANEAFIQTATQPSSVVNLAAMLGYQPTLSAGSSTTLSITLSGAVPSVSLPVGTQFSTVASATQTPIVFQTTNAVNVTTGGSNSTITVPVIQGTTYSSLPAANWAQFSVPSSATPIPTTAISNGSVNQAYQLFYSPVAANTFYVYVDLGTGPTQWTYTQSLINNGPYDQVYTNFVDGNNNMWIVFGDGTNGYVPPLGTPIYVTYNTSNGAASNVGPNTITQAFTAIVGVVGVTNAAAASGGADAESVASIRVNAPASLQTLNRAVTLSDFQTLATQVAGVQWASAVQSTYQIVSLYVCPYGGGIPTTLLQSQVLTYMNARAMANTTITIYPPTYVYVNLTVTVTVFPSYSQAAVQTAIQTALSNLLSLTNTGFGFRVALGLVYQTILAVSGVNYAIIGNLNRTVWATLTTALYAAATPGTISSINVTPLPEAVAQGDNIVITSNTATPTTLTLVAAIPVPAGAVTIPVQTYTLTGPINYPVGSTIQDTGNTGQYVADVVTLSSEIPVVGTLLINTNGGLP